MQVKLRFMTENDIIEVTNIFINVYAESPWNEKWSYDNAFRRIKDLFNITNNVSVVCIVDNKIVGAIIAILIPWLTGYQLEVREFFIIKNLQDKGIGSAMLNQLSSYCNTNKEVEIVLYTKRDSRLQYFYEKNGFQAKDDTIYYSKVINKRGL